MAQLIRGRSAVVASIALIGISGLLASCGGSGTVEVDPTPTTQRPTVPSSIPWDQSRSGLIETLTKMGLDERQAGCVVDRMDELDRRGVAPTGSDRTQIEKLIEDCLAPGADHG